MSATRMLDRKLVRDLWRLRWQMAAIALLVACGVSVGVMASSARRTITRAQDGYYVDTRFADVFATATRAPRAIVRDLAGIDGVVDVDARAMRSGLAVVPGLVRPASVRLISLPDDDRRALNRLVLMAGRWPDPSRTDEAVALRTFLDAAHVGLGDTLPVTIAGRLQRFTIVGSALSPEYVYVPGASPMPDDAHSAVFWAPRAAVEQQAGLVGAFSAVSLALATGASRPAVLAAVDRLLAPYGGVPAFARADQVSHKFQADRIARLGVIATALPPVFLGVAALLVHLVLGRMVEAEREQVGLLKAFGYGDVEVARIYVEMAALVSLVGVAAGGLFGAWTGQAITRELARYLRFPHLTTRFSWTAFAVSALTALAFAIAGSIRAVRRAVRVSPALAMQPPAPAVFRRGLIERLGIWRALDQPTRMIVRDLERYAGRAVLTMLGLAVSLSLIVGTAFLYGSFDSVIDQAFYRARRWTDEVGFVDIVGARGVADLTHLPGVLRAEPLRIVAARIGVRAGVERAAVIGMDDEARLSHPLDRSGRRIAFRGRGVVLSYPLSQALGIGPGGSVEIDVITGRRPDVRLPVTAIADDNADFTVYMDRRALNEVMADGDVASGADLDVAADAKPAFYAAIAARPEVAGTMSRDDTVATFRTNVIEAMSTEMTFFFGFAAAIAFGIAYNVTRIAFAERARDMATLRVLGFDQGTCAYIMSGELAVLALVGIPIGMAGGVGLAQILVAAFARQGFYIPVIVTPWWLAIAVTIYLAAVVVAAVLVVQRLWTLDLVAVLKTRD